MQPPWEKYPNYERYTIGWRMGSGEQYRYDWADFLKTVPADFEARLEYLRQYRPAPINWWENVRYVLDPTSDDIEHDEEDPEWEEKEKAEIGKLLELGVIAYDAAYRTWLGQQTAFKPPWLHVRGSAPGESMRYYTRDFWFISRHAHQLRAENKLDQVIQSSGGVVPDVWKPILSPLRTGKVGDLDLSQGLHSFAIMLFAGDIRAPWSLGLSPDDFKDSFELDMGYSDAFRLWVMSAFDDDQLFWQMFPEGEIPADWKAFVKDQLLLF
ncbi:MAG: hypothetical protein AAF570_05145 [Bacteroidota bacterium]